MDSSLSSLGCVCDTLTFCLDFLAMRGYELTVHQISSSSLKVLSVRVVPEMGKPRQQGIRNARQEPTD